MTLISVLVLTYAHEDTLAQTLDSICAQDLPEDVALEIVIALDASPDQTSEVAARFAALYPASTRVITGPKNLGMMENLRRGLAACRGQFIALCEGDDYWTHPQKLAMQLDGLEASKDLWVSATKGEKLFPDGKRELGWQLRQGHGPVDARAVMAKGGLAVPTASLVWRAAALANLPDWLFRAPVGDVFLLLAGLRDRGLWYVDENCVTYRTNHVGSWSERFHRWSPTERDRYARGMIQAYRDAIASFGIAPRVLGPRLARFHRLRADLALDQRNWRGALRHARELPPKTLFRLLGGRMKRIGRTGVS